MARVQYFGQEQAQPSVLSQILQAVAPAAGMLAKYLASEPERRLAQYQAQAQATEAQARLLQALQPKIGAVGGEKYIYYPETGKLEFQPVAPEPMTEYQRKRLTLEEKIAENEQKIAEGTLKVQQFLAESVDKFRTGQIKNEQEANQIRKELGMLAHNTNMLLAQNRVLETKLRWGDEGVERLRAKNEAKIAQLQVELEKDRNDIARMKAEAQIAQGEERLALEKQIADKEAEMQEKQYQLNLLKETNRHAEAIKGLELKERRITTDEKLRQQEIDIQKQNQQSLDAWRQAQIAQGWAKIELAKQAQDATEEQFNRTFEWQKTMDQKHYELEVRNADRQDRLAELEKDRFTFEKQIETLRTTIQQEELAVQKMRAETERMTTEERKKYQERMVEIEDRRERHQFMLGQMQHQLNVMKFEQSKLEADRNYELAVENQDIEKQRLALQEKITAHQQIIDERRVAVEEANQRLKELQAEREHATEQRRLQIEEEMAMWQKQVDKWNHEIQMEQLDLQKDQLQLDKIKAETGGLSRAEIIDRAYQRASTAVRSVYGSPILGGIMPEQVEQRQNLYNKIFVNYLMNQGFTAEEAQEALEAHPFAQEEVAISETSPTKGSLPKLEGEYKTVFDTIWNQIDKEHIKILQTRLAEQGLYKGPIDGKKTGKLKEALVRAIITRPDLFGISEVK